MAGPLAYVYGRANALRRQLGDLVSDPVGSVQQTLGGLQDAHRENQMLQAQAFANPREPFAVTDQNALGQLANKMLTGPLGMAPAGMTAWHGSPHVFDRFDSSKIGTGEGAQVYGHGLYLAQQPAVAQDYATKLSQGKTTRALRVQQTLPDEAWDEIGPVMQRLKIPGDIEPGQTDQGFVRQLLDEFSGLMNKAERDILERHAAPKGGYVYKVDLPDEKIAQMLDWDAVVSTQPEAVRAGVKKALMASGQPASVADYIVQNKTGREALSTIGHKNYDARLLPPQGPAAVESSNLLRQHGIPGVRYLDQGSRFSGHHTRNFVVFPGEENALKILERNGQALGPP